MLKKAFSEVPMFENIKNDNARLLQNFNCIMYEDYDKIVIAGYNVLDELLLKTLMNLKEDHFIIFKL